MPQKLPRGLPLEEAFRFWTNPKKLQELDVYKEYWWHPPIWFSGPPTPYEVMHDKWCEIRAPLEQAFLEKLRSGELVAIALAKPVGANSTRDAIGPELWDVIQPDFEHSGASGAGLELIKIEIVARESVPDVSAADATLPGASRSRRIHLSPGDDQLTLDGELMIFTGAIQQTIIRQLVDALEQGRRLRTHDLLTDAGSNADTIAKAFKGSPHWHKLKRILRQKSGYCWFDLEASPP